jgi:mannose/fructose/N-acetylgalactosamine-specific phosphotransferase system component IIC
MGSYSFLSSIIAYAGSVPLLLVWLAGGALALQNWQSRPRASRLCLLSMALMLVWFVVQTVLQVLLPHMTEYITDVIWLYAGLAAIGHLVTACGFGLLLWALFGRHEIVAKG